MNRVPRRVRLRLVAAVSVILVLVGGSGATAYWTGQTQAQEQASAAATGLQVQVLPSVATTPLAVTYTAQNLTAAGAVTIRNTGSRAAASALVLTAQSPTDSRLPAAVRVAVAPIIAAADCTPQRVLSAPTTGTLSASTALTASGTLAAGATATLCIQTSIASGDAATLASQSLRVAVAATLTYAAAPGWVASSPVSVVTQAVGAGAAAPVLHDAARYTMKHEGFCIQRARSSVARGAQCGWDSEWRFVSAPGGTFHILAATNAAGDRQTAPRWTAVQPGSQAVQSASPDGSAAQQWRITAGGASTYRIESVSSPGYCATIGAGLYNPNDTNPRRVVLAVCDPTAATQAFAFEMVGAPLASQQLDCEGSGWNITLKLAKNTPYEAEIEYAVFIAREATPGVRTALGNLSSSGYHPSFRIASNNADLIAFVNANGGAVGDARIFVEQRIAQSAWLPVADAQVRTWRNGSNLQVSCGWQ